MSTIEKKKQTWKERFDEVIKPENELKNEHPGFNPQFISDCKKFRTESKSYMSNGPSSWTYSMTDVYNANNEVIFKIPNNYGSKCHFFTCKGATWLLSGYTYTTQLFLNLNTMECYTNHEQLEIPNDQFCWYYDQIKLSPDGNTILVLGCFWGSGDCTFFYDFTDPSKGWPKLSFQLPSYPREKFQTIAADECDEGDTHEEFDDESRKYSFEETCEFKWMDDNSLQVTFSDTSLDYFTRTGNTFIKR
jgi:hypothetical protein